MRCKPGELALVTGAPMGEDSEINDFMRSFIGKVVRVTALTGRDPNHPCWHIESPFHVTYKGIPILCDCIEDDYLTPLRGDARGNGVAVKTNIPEAVTLAWGIHAPVLA